MLTSNDLNGDRKADIVGISVGSVQVLLSVGP
jgi:hypothetical protein